MPSLYQTASPDWMHHWRIGSLNAPKQPHSVAGQCEYPHMLFQTLSKLSPECPVLVLLPFFVPDCQTYHFVFFFQLSLSVCNPRPAHTMGTASRDERHTTAGGGGGCVGSLNKQVQHDCSPPKERSQVEKTCWDWLVGVSVQTLSSALTSFALPCIDNSVEIIMLIRWCHQQSWFTMHLAWHEAFKYGVAAVLFKVYNSRFIQ